jgi:cytochrome c peroxidase
MRHPTSRIAAGATLFLAGNVAMAGGQDRGYLQNLKSFSNPTGAARSYSSRGTLSTSVLFFRSLGTNGRACVHCHEPGAGWSITPAGLQARFKQTSGLDPVFRPVDGANTPNAPVATVAQRREAYSLLLHKGLIRVAHAIPAGAEFRLAEVDDPYHYAHAGEVSMYRRPLPSANLNFVSAVMWDGRESPIPALNAYLPPQEEHFRHQAGSAITDHAQGLPFGEDGREALVLFERSLTVAQSTDQEAGDLTAQGGKGGPVYLSQQRFHMGINDSLLPDPSGAPSSSSAFHLYDAWLNLPGNSKRARARRAVARGEVLFNTKPIQITGVSGLNDELGQPLIVGTCTTCHNNPNVGNHTMRRSLNIGVTDEAERTPDLPLYTLERLDAQGEPTGELKKTTDPGRAMISGKWEDIGRFKGPVLRGLAARAPYFHNGLAATLGDAVDFYDRRFEVGFTDQEKADLVAFLRAL